jgi:hypothetical protein
VSEDGLRHSFGSSAARSVDASKNIRQLNTLQTVVPIIGTFSQLVHIVMTTMQ